MQPFFSVIITTYNRASLLTRALDALLRQTETDWEAHVIDDGSTDNTQAMVFPYTEKATIFYHRNMYNKGYVHALNRGFGKANGKYITILDSDDEYEDFHLESRKKNLLENDGLTFLYGGVKIIGSLFVPDRFDTGRQIHLSECVIGGTFFFTKALAEELKGFKDMSYGSDADFFDRALQSKAVIMKTDIPSYIYHREEMNSITHNLSNQ